MNKFFAYLFGAGAGAGLMYFFDPAQGNRRRALVRDQVTSIQNDADDAIQAGVRDLQNRVQGLSAGVMDRFSSEQPTDWVLAERARSRLGFLTPHPKALEVSAQNGTLVLQGDVLRSDVDRLISGLSTVRGVSGIDNRMHVHDQPGDISALQGGDQGMMMQGPGQWAPSTRLLGGVGSLYLLMRGMGGGLLGPLYTLGGLALGLRTIVNRPFDQMMGMSGQHGLINVIKTIQVNAPVEDVFGLWSNFTEFPKFMSHVREIRDIGDGHSHWVVDGPAGIPVEFDTVITQEIPDELIAWQTTGDSTVKHTGQVRFRAIRNGGTQVNVRMSYNPPAGVVGAAVAKFFGSDPKSEMDDDLMRLKSLLETSEANVQGQTMREQNMNRA